MTDAQKEEKKTKTFAEKYNLEETGKPVKISKRTKKFTDALNNEEKRAIEAGEDYAKTENRGFG